MFCKKCGEEIAEDVVFCPKCGQKQVEESPETAKIKNLPQRKWLAEVWV